MTPRLVPGLPPLTLSPWDRIWFRGVPAHCTDDAQSWGGLGVLPLVGSQGCQLHVSGLAAPAQFTRITRPRPDATTQPLERRERDHPCPHTDVSTTGSAHISCLKFAQTLLPPGPPAAVPQAARLRPCPDPPGLYPWCTTQCMGVVHAKVHTAVQAGAQTCPQPCAPTNTAAFRILVRPVPSSCRLSHPPPARSMTPLGSSEQVLTLPGLPPHLAQVLCWALGLLLPTPRGQRPRLCPRHLHAHVLPTHVCVVCLHRQPCFGAPSFRLINTTLVSICLEGNSTSILTSAKFKAPGDAPSPDLGPLTWPWLRWLPRSPRLPPPAPLCISTLCPDFQTCPGLVAPAPPWAQRPAPSSSRLHY